MFYCTPQSEFLYTLIIAINPTVLLGFYLCIQCVLFALWTHAASVILKNKNWVSQV